MIALARRSGIAKRIVLGWLVQRFLRRSPLFDADSITSGLSSSIFFAVCRNPVFQIGFREPPSPGGVLAITTAVPVQGMIRRETTVASLEQALSGGKTRPFGLRTGRRARILKLGQGELILPERQVSLGSGKLLSEAIFNTTAAIGY